MSGLYLNRGKGLQNNARLTASSNPEEAQRNTVFSQHQREREVREGGERRKEDGGGGGEKRPEVYVSIRCLPRLISTTLFFRQGLSLKLEPISSSGSASP